MKYRINLLLYLVSYDMAYCTLSGSISLILRTREIHSRNACNEHIYWMACEVCYIIYNNVKCLEQHS